MKNVKVKVVIFLITETMSSCYKKNTYCGYSPVINAISIEKQSESCVIEEIKETLYELLCHRLRYSNLWKVAENSVIPPIFADKDLIRLTESIFGTTIGSCHK